MTDATPAPTPATMLADRALVRLSGDDVRGFLQGLVTQDVSGDRPVWTGLLTPQGKALFDFIVWPDGADLLLDVEAGAAEGLMRRLALYRLRRALSIALENRRAVHWSTRRETAIMEAMPDPRLEALGWRWTAPPASAAEGWHAHRLSLGVPEGAEELGNGDTLWLECNAAELNGVSFTKGCYIGQENTARMHYRAKVNRRLVVEPIDRGDPDRVRVRYPALGLQVALRRTDALDAASIPAWLAPALAQEPTIAAD